MSNGPIAKVRVTEPSTLPEQLELHIAVREDVLREQDWKPRLLRMLARLLPGITKAELNHKDAETYHLAVRKSKCELSSVKWKDLTAHSLNEQIADINGWLFLAVAPAGPDLPMCYYVACVGPVNEFDIQAVLTDDDTMVRRAWIGPDMYNGEVMVVYAPIVDADNMESFRSDLEEALRIHPFT